MTAQRAIGRCRTCQLPVRVDIDPVTRAITAVYAVCDCPRPTVAEANQDRAIGALRPELLAAVKARDINRTVAVVKRMYPGEDPESHLRRRRVLLAACRITRP